MLAGQGAKRRVLVVDDESDITTTLQIGLEASSFDVDAYNDQNWYCLTLGQA
jgi:DNA-binding response OmpR family regulator